jgi:hypothetical protein
MCELLRRDLFPAELLLADGRVLRECRVFVTTSRLLAWQVNQSRVDVACDLDLAVAGSVGLKRDTTSLPLVVDTEAGTVYVNRGRGCGCHSPLKALGAPVPWTARELMPV